MSGKDGGWLLPEVVNPPTSSSVCICIPDDENHVAAFWGALQELAYWFNWQRDPAHTGLAASIKWQAIVSEAHQKWLDGVMCTSCSELIECLQPLIDGLSAQITALQATADETKALIEAGQGADKVKEPAPYEVPSCDEGKSYAGAVAVVEAMNQNIIDIFEQAEVSGTDTRDEMLGLLISAVPAFETLPIDEMFEFVDWYYQNQQDTYEADYTVSWRDEVACLLWCEVVAGDCTVTSEMIGNWLSSLRALYPGNLAADIFARYGDAMTPTLLNQVGMLYQELYGNKQGSIEDFFRELIQAFGVGAQLTNPGYGDCDCANVWEVVQDLTTSQYNWTFPTTSTGVWGDWLTGEGIRATYGIDAAPSCVKMFIAQLQIGLTAASTLEEVEIVYSLDFIPPHDGVGLDYLRVDTSTLWSLAPQSLPEGTMQTYTMDMLSEPLTDGDVIELSLRCLRRFITVPDAGYVILHSITFRGTGQEPTL